MQNNTSAARVAVIGELNVDLVATGLESLPVLGHESLATDFEITLGSASAIFACGIARLGHEVTFMSQVGADEFGQFCLRTLRAAGVSTGKVLEDPTMKTGVTISVSTPEDRALVTFLGAISELEVGQLRLDDLAGHSHLHLTSYFLQHRLRPAFPTIMQEAKKYGLSTSFDPNSDPTSGWDKTIWDVIREIDILFLNESEALQLTRRHDAADALKDLSELAACVVIKRGPRGSVANLDGETIFCDGFKVTPVDTTGAGDSFAAGFIHGFLEQKDLLTRLRFGNACGALSTLKAGGTTNQPTHFQLTDFLCRYDDR